MDITVKGKGIEITPAMKSYAEKRLAKLDKFFERGNLEASVTMSVERGIHTVDVTLMVDGLFLRGENKTQDMYASIDGAVDKIERQVHKYKTKINRKLKLMGNEIVDAVVPNPPDEFEEEKVIARIKKFPMKPMTSEEAIMQMELLGHDFFVFVSASSEDVNVIYKRKDGHYGLIEPEL